MRTAVQTVVEKAARQTRQTQAFWLKAHAGMGLNKEADIQAKKRAAMQVDRSWHETDFGGLMYQDIEDDEAYYRQG
eukprot:2450808-Rhodomonas_salina.1